MKTQILAAIGETGLTQASGINAALAANDRVKYAFSLLQTASSHARHPDRPAAGLKKERIACGIDDPDLDSVVASATMLGKSCRVAGGKRLIDRIAGDMRLMAAPMLAARPDGIAARLDGLLGALPSGAQDLIDPDAIEAMTEARHGGKDSLHRLVMDLHKGLNVLQADLSQEKLSGAAVYGLGADDRPLVQAFMAGVNRTSRLKFDHPGLDTTATRSGTRLIIQNDIGTTDAHVIVIHVEGLVVSVTYTDVHAERLAFFQDMLKGKAVVWDEVKNAALAEGSTFAMTTGRFEAADLSDCKAYLEHLGSRLVFLIDWNRARKQLRGFLRSEDRLALLLSAAETESGHRAFLELGGARVINQAIEETAGSSVRFGDRLCDVLGDAPTLEFLKFVLSTATEGLLAGQSHALIRDRIRVTLATHFSNEERRLLRLAEDHAGLIFEIAGLVRDGLQAEAASAGKRARRARRFEHDADLLVLDVCKAVKRRPEYAVFRTLLQTADDAADALEDAAFFLDLHLLEGKPMEELRTLADLLVEASQEWIKALGSASDLSRNASEAEKEDFLTAVDRLVALEHQADDAERALSASAIREADDFRQLHLFNAIGARLEVAADALKHSTTILRDHILTDLIDG